MSARRAALLVAVLLGAALVVVIAVRTPWDALGGLGTVDPTAGLSSEQLARADAFVAAVRPASAFSLLLSLFVAAVLGLTTRGARIVHAVAGPLRRRWGWQVLLGVPALLILGRLVTLPVSAYGELVRHRYGLSTRSWGLWLRDVVVSTAIGAALSAAALLGLIWLIRRAPRTWWVWASVTAAATVVVGSFLYPVFVEPAYNSFTPLPEGQLRTDLLALADVSGVPVQDVLVSDASRRTTTLNAYVSGFGGTRRIVVYDTVLEQLPDAELKSIVAHELGHVAGDDVLTGTLIGALGAATGTALLGWLLSWTPLLRRAGVQQPGDPRVVGLVLLLVSVGGLVSTPVQNLVSRHVEARADRFALDATDDPAAFIAMQQRLVTVNLGDPDPPVAWHWFFGSHPTAAQRVALAELRIPAENR